MSDTEKDVHLDDPLSEETRKEKRILLGVSLFGIAMVKAGIVPKKSAHLGLTWKSRTNAPYYIWCRVQLCIFSSPS